MRLTAPAALCSKPYHLRLPLMGRLLLDQDFRSALLRRGYVPGAFDIRSVYEAQAHGKGADFSWVLLLRDGDPDKPGGD